MRVHEILLLTLIFSIHSCIENDYSGLEPDCACSSAEHSVDLIIDKEISIQQPIEFDGRFPNYSYHKASNGQEYLTFCGNGQDIQVFNLTTQVLKTVISPNHDKPIINEIGNTYFHNLDSIFFFQNRPPKAFLTNLDNDLLATWDLRNAPVNWGNVQNYTLHFSNPNFLLKNHQFYVSLNTSQFFKINPSLFSDLKTEAIFDVKENSWKGVFGKLPPYYTSSEGFEIEPQFNVPDKLIVNDKVYLSYPQGHKIDVYSSLGDSIGTYCAASKSIESLSMPLTKKESLDRQKGFIHFASAPTYLGLYYHSDINLFTRLVRHRFEIETANGELRSPCEIQYSLMVFDENLNLLNEIRLDNLLYDWKFAIGTSNGFWLMPICDKWPGEDIMNYTTHLSISLD